MTVFFVRDLVAEALQRAGELVTVRGEPPPSFTGITDDSRLVAPGALFIAIRGHTSDGHDFLPAAGRGGATAAIVEDPGRTMLPTLVVRDSRRAAGIAAAAAFGEPARDIAMVGITGTNGKTTTAGMLRHLLDDPPGTAASIGTLGVLTGSRGDALPGGQGLTTPGPVELHRVLRALADAGIRRIAVEVSSHSLEQRRVEGLRFAAAVFTNVTHDHLDYHGSMEAYVAAKAKLLSHVVPGGAVIVNADDGAWSTLDWPRRVLYGLVSPALDVTAEDIRYVPQGSTWTLRADSESAGVQLPLIGDFNVMNALGAAAAAWATGQPVSGIAERLSTMPQVPGRLERLLEQPAVLRDYAHTPDALARALDAVRPFALGGGRLIVVFGCGGDRDRGKRPLMGAIADQKADIAIVTSDNPRTEDPERILDDIESGMRRGHERIEDRRRAIARALELATMDDVVVLAGKGHETYQIRGTTSYPFDEREVVRELMSERRDHGGGVAA